MKSTASKKNFSFIMMMMFSFTWVWAQAPILQGNGQPNKEGHTINPVIGDISFVSKYGYYPDATTDEKLRIRTHFDYVETLLRQRDVSNLSPEMQLRRQHMIDLFHDYAIAGAYPRNYDFKDQRKPCFIDKDNTICAVGYLVEQTVGREVAETINNKHKYDDVLAMNDGQVDSWIADTGLSKEEVAMIQPTYGGGYGWDPCSGNSNKIWRCRISNCVQECKCINPNQEAQWMANGRPCEPDGSDGNQGGGNGFAVNTIKVYAKFAFDYIQSIL